jgi:hypothetical protein
MQVKSTEYLITKGAEYRRNFHDPEYKAQVVERARKFGALLMHRRNGQYWVMQDRPMMLSEIDALLRAQGA